MAATAILTSAAKELKRTRFELLQAGIELGAGHFQLDVGGVRLDWHRLADGERHSGERLRNLGAIPAAQAPVRRGLEMKRQHRIACRLGQPDGARLRHTRGTSGTIDGESRRL